ARSAALVFAANGIKVYLFDSATSVSELSFAIRDLKCDGGVAITASHNPKDYNGYKVYAPWGGQMLENDCEQIAQYIGEQTDLSQVKCADGTCAIDEGMLTMLGADMDEKYYARLLGMTRNQEMIGKHAGSVKAVYTPLFGTGMRTFEGTIVKMPYMTSVVQTQEKPNPEFPGISSPNPESEKTLALAIAQAKRIGADIALGTDPDADRLGAAIPNENGEFVLMSGNQIGCVIIDYLLRQQKQAGKLKPSDYIIKSFVSSRMADDMAARFGIECVTVPTGFKYVSDVVHNQYAPKGFVFGFEESCGFLAGDFVADKDGIMAAMLLLEVMCECKAQGVTMYERLDSLYEEYGWHMEKLLTVMLDGEMDRVGQIMKGLRDNPPRMIGGQQVIELKDYLNDERELNVLFFTLENGWICVRPSGTEPKLKVYYGVCGEIKQESAKLLGALDTSAKELVGN
ncbi:MAG: phospho-sugar mutase, partial [Clostridia bacterium]|nr:phospho-sugar mutase [Clostridia bacterium]